MSDREHQKIRHLLIVKDRRGKKAIPLSLDIYSLGRAKTNSIILVDSSVSRQHATIYPVVDSDEKFAPFRVIDGDFEGNKSTNGLIVNGSKCKIHHLKHGDVIEFGDYVKVTYYTLFNLSDFEFNQFCELQSKSKIVRDSIVNLQAPTKENIIDSSSIERDNLIHLASFPELMPYPIVEINLSGSISYINPIAIANFPQLKLLDKKHPLINELPKLVKEKAVDHFVREIKLEEKILEQLVQFIAERQTIRVFIIDISTRYKKLEIADYKDRLLRECLLVSGKDFETSIQSLLKIGCDIFGLECGFIGRLNDNNLQIVAIEQPESNDRLLEREQIIEISQNSDHFDNKYQLLQNTLESNSIVTSSDFEANWMGNLTEQKNTRDNNIISLKSYLGLRLIIDRSTYGLLGFCSQNYQVDDFEPEKRDFLHLMARCLIETIEKQKIKLLLQKGIEQKEYYQQIEEETNHPMADVRELVMQLLTLIDSHHTRT